MSEEIKQSEQNNDASAKANVDSSNSDQPSSPKNMEVHHHPQLHHERKPWKEYLLEGLMISIAVMLGFIAENIREGITNRQHAKELTTQLVQDLKADSAQLNKAYQGESKIFAANDSLVNMLQRHVEKNDMEKLVNNVVQSLSMWPFHPAGGAIAAIKNELHLKQFSNSKIINYISIYESHISLLHTVQDITQQYQRSLIEPFLLHHVGSRNLEEAFEKNPLTNVEMRNLSSEDLVQLGSDMVLVRINTKEAMDDNRGVYQDLVRLLEYVKKQYNIEGE